MTRIMSTLDDYIDYENDEDKCAYCSKHTFRGSRMILPNRSFKPSKWHDSCVARFIANNMDQCWDRYADMEKVMNSRPDGIIVVIERPAALTLQICC